MNSIKFILSIFSFHLEHQHSNIALQNPAVRNLGRGGGFWRSRTYNTVDWALPSYGRQSFFNYPWHVPGIAINVSSSGVTRIALEYGKRIQWCLYEAAWIWRLKAPLGIKWNSFCLTFFPWTLWVVSFPRLHLLYKAPWEEHSPHPLALELFGSSRFPLFLDKKDATWTMDVAAEAKRNGAKFPPILQLDKK